MKAFSFLVLLALAGCGASAAPGGTAGSGGNGTGGTGGSSEESQGLVGATIDGSLHEFHFESGGVTPDGYTTFLADESDGPTLSISFAGVAPGDYDCTSPGWTRIDYAQSSMQASSAKSGACVIHVEEVGDPGQPIRGIFDGTLSTSDGKTIEVTGGTFDVPNVIP